MSGHFRNPSGSPVVPLILRYSVRPGAVVPPDFSPAPGTFGQYKRITVNASPTELIELDPRTVDSVGGAVATYPKPEREALARDTPHAVPRRLAPKKFHCADQTCRPLKLLCGEHPQRVAHKNICAVTLRAGRASPHQEALVEHVECHHGEVGFSLAAARGKPDEIHYLAFR